MKEFLTKVSKIGEAKNVALEDSKVLATNIFGITYPILLYKIKSDNTLDIPTLYKEYEKFIFSKYKIS